MSTTIPAVPTGGAALPTPGAGPGVGNVINAPKLAEKTIELTSCAQFGHLFATRMVWFGLTQKQERQYGFDAATNLGGHAFILQFKVSTTVPATGPYAGMRRFACQHQQMDRLRTVFGGVHNCCFYFLPNLGTFNDLLNSAGDVLGNSFMADVANLPNPVPPTHRQNGYHYAYLDAAIPELTITSQPFKSPVNRADDFARITLKQPSPALVSSKRLVALARNFAQNERIADLFFKNAALAVVV